MQRHYMILLHHLRSLAKIDIGYYLAGCFKLNLFIEFEIQHVLDNTRAVLHVLV